MSRYSGCSRCCTREKLAPGLCERGTRSEPRDGDDRLTLVHRHRQPEVDAVRIVEPGRCHAHHREARLFVRLDQAPADDVGVAAELLPPGAITEHQDLRCTHEIIVGAKHAAEKRANAEDVEVVAGDDRAAQEERAGAVHHRKLCRSPVHHTGNLGQPRIRVAQLLEVVVGDAKLDAGRLVCPHHGDVLLVAHRQSLHEHGAHHRRDGGGHADREAEDQDGGDSDDRCAAEAAQGDAKVGGIHTYLMYARRDRVRNSAGGRLPMRSSPVPRAQEPNGVLLRKLKRMKPIERTRRIDPDCIELRSCPSTHFSWVYRSVATTVPYTWTIRLIRRISLIRLSFLSKAPLGFGLWALGFGLTWALLPPPPPQIRQLQEEIVLHRVQRQAADVVGPRRYCTIAEVHHRPRRRQIREEKIQLQLTVAERDRR